MEKRLPLALFLSFLVLLGWSILSPKPPVDPEAPRTDVPGDFGPGGATGVDGSRTQPEFTGGEVVAERVAAAEEREIPLSLGEPGRAGSFDAVFSNRGARLLSLRVGDYWTEQGLDPQQQADPEYWIEVVSSVESQFGRTGSLAFSASESAKALLTEPLEEALWESQVLSSGGIEFRYAPGTGVTFVKRVLPVPGTHQLRLELEITNQNAPELAGVRQFRLTPAEVIRPVGNERFYQEPQVIAVWDKGSGDLEVETAIQRDSGADDPAGALTRPGDAPLAFAGTHNKFFAMLIRADDPETRRGVISAGYRRIRDLDWLRENPGQDEDSWKYVVSDLALQLDVPGAGETRTWNFALYAGPKQRELLEEACADYGELIDEDVGMFSGIASVITAIMGFYSRLVGNWGWGIILMTLTIRLLLFPLNRRSQTAMARYAKKMKRVQPRLNEIKEKHKNDPQKLREAQGLIMKEEGAFPPLGGCLPMFLQFPVFIGLFQALRVDFDLRHEPFLLWMKDLSMPDRLLHINFDTHLPFIGTIEYLNILPILMVGLWIAQHKVMPQPTTSDPNAERTRKMMIVMQVFFAFLFYNYASGLALYMITSSSVAIFEVGVIKKLWPIDDAEQEKKKPGRFMQKMANMQKQQAARVEQEQRRRASSKKKGGKKKR